MAKAGLSQDEMECLDEDQKEEKRPMIKKGGALTVPHLSTAFSPNR